VNTFGIYAQDPRLLAAYTIPEAAHYLLIPRATLHSWFVGRVYRAEKPQRHFQPVLRAPTRDRVRLSFINFVEAHVLNAIRREHHISLDKVRIAIGYLSRHFGSEHPLAEYRFETDGIDLFIQKYGQLINITRDGQTAIRELLQCFLRRIEWDEAGTAVRLYPFTRKPASDAPKSVVIDPRISFGRPVLRGTGIATAVVAERYKAGESIQELARDYCREPLEIEEAIRCELQLEAA